MDKTVLEDQEMLSALVFSDDIKKDLGRAVLHEFSNWIGGIYAISDLYGSNEYLEEDVRKAFLDIKGSASKAHIFMRKATGVLVGGREDAVFFELKQCLNDVHGLLRAVVPKYCGLSMDLSSCDAGVVEGSQVEFERGLISLVVKITHILSKGGGINLRMSEDSIKLIIEGVGEGAGDALEGLKWSLLDTGEVEVEYKVKIIK